MELNGTRVNSGYSVLLECEYKEVLPVVLVRHPPLYMF